MRKPCFISAMGNNLDHGRGNECQLVRRGGWPMVEVRPVSLAGVGSQAMIHNATRTIHLLRPE
jgi:hypothetical protein